MRTAGEPVASCHAHLAGPFHSPDAAFAAAWGWVRSAPDGAQLETLGDFVLPPVDAPPSRGFQTLHIDFGLPLSPTRPADVGRYTALHVPLGASPPSAVTRLVSLTGLLAYREWPPREELLRRFSAYGASHGAWDDADGYAEGSVARLVEAATGAPPRLPSVKAEPGFLCGTEFADLAAELAFFDSHDLPVAELEVEVRLAPGEVLVFDNLALAHGRRGSRRPGELRQRVFGHRALSPGGQRELRDGVLRAFAGAAARVLRPTRPVHPPT